MGLRDYLFRKEMARSFRHGRFVSWSSVRSVLILAECSSEAEVAEVVAVAGSARGEGVRAVVCIYTEVKSLSVTLTDTLYLLRRKDLTLFGRLRKDAASALFSADYDVVVDLSRRQPLALCYALVRAVAKMRCGRQGGAYDLYDFMIDDSAASSAELFRQIRLYLGMIKES